MTPAISNANAYDARAASLLLVLLRRCKPVRLPRASGDKIDTGLATLVGSPAPFGEGGPRGRSATLRRIARRNRLVE